MQPDLFAVDRQPKPRRVSAQRENLARVGSNIGADVLAFVQSVGVGNEFHGAELAAFVVRKHRCSPSSPDRILRDLRRNGKLNYELLSRPQSRYRVEAIQ